MRPLTPILRRTTQALLILLILLFAFVQIQQHLLRHRAERLHAEILALQLHPGTFADIQRLQKEWGRHAHYDGECTPHHCIYQIALRDLSEFLPSGGRDPWYFRAWMFRPYEFLGGRPTKFFAELRVHNNQMWGADDGIGMGVYEAASSNDEFGYFALAAESKSGPRLYDEMPRYRASTLKRGYDIGKIDGCMISCTVGWVYTTPSANPTDLRRVSSFNFGCITSRKPCRELSDLIPNAWSQYTQENKSETPDGDRFDCSPPLEMLAREAANVVTVQVLSITSTRGPIEFQDLTVTVLNRYKNADRLRPEIQIRIDLIPQDMITTPNSASRLETGWRYILMFRTRRPQLEPCTVVPLTAQTLSAVQRGIAMDASTGEPYSWRDDSR